MITYYGPYYYALVEFNGRKVRVFGEHHENIRKCTGTSHTIVQYITEQLQGANPPDIFIEMPVDFTYNSNVKISCSYLNPDILNSLRTCMIVGKTEHVHFTDIRPLLGHLPYQDDEDAMIQNEYDHKVMSEAYLFPVLFAIEFSRAKKLSWDGSVYKNKLLTAMQTQNTRQCIEVYRNAMDTVYEEYLFDQITKCENTQMIVYNGGAHAVRLVEMLEKRTGAFISNEQFNKGSCVQF